MGNLYKSARLTHKDIQEEKARESVNTTVIFKDSSGPGKAQGRDSDRKSSVQLGSPIKRIRFAG